MQTSWHKMVAPSCGWFRIHAGGGFEERRLETVFQVRAPARFFGRFVADTPYARTVASALELSLEELEIRPGRSPGSSPGVRPRSCCAKPARGKAIREFAIP
ncbi:MAG: hypothetical protein GY856_28150 [bacterium]|nr:hypothetical protein [bacterium]